jgi:Arc/MetJ family transcription regulator
VCAFTVVKRTNINLDMDLVDEAARELGTRGRPTPSTRPFVTSSPARAVSGSLGVISRT